MASDYQRVVEYLRDLRQGALQHVSEEITQAAGEYAALCVSANERLRKCSGFLQQGLRSEAIHLAEESPNLLDLVAALDLPDPQTWSEFCQNNGLGVAPPLQMDRAAQLNEAYALDQPLEHLLSRHRVLALSRGPVRERLEVLRRIAQIDSSSGTWEKDIRVFERARLRELPSAFYSAVKKRDEQAIASLMNELNQNAWFEPVPPDLSTAVGDAFNRMQRASCEVELRKLVEPLRDAFAARSVQECQALAQRWKKTLAARGVSRVSADLDDEIKPVVAFINEQEKREEYLKRFRDSCKTFGKMLDRDVGDTELEAGYAKLNDFKEPIPEELTERYAEKRKLRQKTIDRRHKIRLMTIGASAAGIVVVVLIAGWLMMRTQSAQSWGLKIQQANAAGRLEDAQKYIAQLRKDNPGFLNDPAVAPFVLQTQTLQAQHDNDSALLSGLLQEVEAADKGATPVAANAQATVDEMLASARTVQEALSKADKSANELAWVDSGKRLANGMIRLQSLATGLRSRASAAVRAEAEQQSAKVEGLTVIPGRAGEAFGQLAQIAGRLEALKAAIGVEEDAKAAVAALGVKIDQRRVLLNAMRSVSGELDNIKQQAVSADDLKKALGAFVQHFPSDPRSLEFTQAMARLGLAKSLEAWRDVASPWGNQFAPSTAAGAQKRIDAITSYLSAYPDSPMGPAASSYQDYLRRGAEGLGETGIWQNDFKDLLVHPFLIDLGYLETSDHRKFFVSGAINRKERKINDQVSVTFTAIDPNKEATGRIEVSIDAPTSVAAQATFLPHVKFVKDLADAVKRVGASDWDTWGIDMVEQLRQDDQIEIVVRATLIQQALKTEEGVAGWALGDTYGKTLGDLARQKPETLAIVNSALVGAGTRAALKEILAAIPAGAAVKQQLAARKNALFKTLAFDVAGTGVALKDDAGHWTIAAQGGASNGNVLWTVLPGAGPAVPAAAASVALPGAAAAEVPAAAPGEGAAAAGAPAAAATAPPANPGSLLQIGAVIDGKFALYENALRNLPQGSIVYITKP